MEHRMYITTADMNRLERLIAGRIRSIPRDAEYLAVLQDRLDRAEVVQPDQIPPDVITMESLTRVRDLDTGAEATYRLVLPYDADAGRGRISVLAPIGTALLGRRVGDTVEWQAPRGRRRLRVLSVPFQPEAASATGGQALARRA